MQMLEMRSLVMRDVKPEPDLSPNDWVLPGLDQLAPAFE
jgi:hypothetical protein